MRHQDKRHRLNRFTSWRKATLASLARSLFLYQSIRTTKERAIAARPLVEKLISLSLQNTLDARRRAFAILQDHKLVGSLFNDIGPRFKGRNSGFTRILSLGQRRGDDASLVLFELTEIKKKEHKKPKKETKKEEDRKTEEAKDAHQEENKPKTEHAVKEEAHPQTKKQQKKFLGGIRNIFKKERDSL